MEGRPLRNGYSFSMFLQKVEFYNDSSDDFMIVFRPSFLRGSTNLPLFCVDVFLQVLGILGNAASVYVLAHKSLRSSTSILLSSMAVYDSMILMTMLALMLHEVAGHRPTYSTTACSVLTTFLQTCGMASISTVVAVTIERYIAVRIPIKARVLCTSSAAFKAIVVIICVSFLTSTPRFLQLYRSDDNLSGELGTCSETTERSTSYLLMCCLLPAVFIFFLPFLTIFVLNVCILRVVLHRERCLTFSGSPSHIINGDKLTFATLGTSTFFFFCCTLPAIYVMFDGFRPDITGNMDDLFGDICCSLVILNFSANFVLYCFLGRTFRSVLLDRLCCHQNTRTVAVRQGTVRDRLASERSSV